MNFSAADYVILIVRDLDRSLNFYTALLGLKLAHRSGDYAQLETGPTRIAIYTRRAMEKLLALTLDAPAENAPSFEIGFKVADVDKAFAELIAGGAPAVVPPADRFWGQRTAYVRDPDGYLVEIVQDLSPP